jgi:4-hydroxy-tetrahydrodipicolinate synthase
MVDMIESFTKGDVERARQLNARMIPSFDYETGLVAPNPVPTKALLRAIGRKVGECRPPMGPTPEGWEDKARQILADLEAARRA